ncbi:DinB family protein [Adhaeribacter aquaticus]|uniref:DinB family protein n=1 Tax=Adhaeribacter aquaticus TaxID=299567 RepID=UPI00041ACE63|nr:DinB family protein [Adhaeribacter aquaticus]
MQNSYLPDVVYELNLISRKVKSEFGGLTTEQLNWKPSADAWSIGQCLDHLIKTNILYFPVFASIHNGRYKKPFLGNLPGLPALTGRMMLKALDPSSAKKLKTPGAFKPAASNIPGTVVTDFGYHQEEFIRQITATDKVKHDKVIVASPISGLITFSLKDCINICVTHEERHFLQAKRVLKNQSFPINTKNNSFSRK